ncbi:MAG TPA: hypothetical protein VGW78_06565 [Candidatus Babeliales bacterium]|jgi:hypothetical protein|nr:hypothetical protein [Candidatus Babeliales bacterium]
MNKSIIHIIIGLITFHLITPLYSAEQPKPMPRELIEKYKMIAAYKKSALGKAKQNIRNWFGGPSASAISAFGALLSSYAATEAFRTSDFRIFLGTIAAAVATTYVGVAQAEKFFQDLAADMYYAPDWGEVLAKFNPNDFDSVVQIGGIPMDKRLDPKYADYKEKEGKFYLLAKGFDDISSINKDDHYEFYLNPVGDKEKNKYISDFFNQLYSLIKSKPLLASTIAFIALRPTPHTAKSVWNGKWLPYVIIGFKPSANKGQAVFLLSLLKKELSNWKGTGKHPRYSEEIPGTNELIYAAYGSGDFKDTQAGQEEYKSMKEKPQSWGNWFWSFVYNMPEGEDMAYKSEDQRISTVPAPGSKD